MLKPLCSLKSLKTMAFGLVTLSAIGMFVACADDPSSPASPEVSNPSPVSSSSVAGNPGPQTPDVPPVSSSTDVQVPPADDLDDNGNPAGPFEDISSSSVTVPSGEVTTPSGAGALAAPYNLNPAPISAVPDADGFYYIADVYKAVPATSKIAFVIRHSERQTCESQESKLTIDGVAHAVTLGQDIGGDEPFYYTATDFIRTRETARNIAVGRGETADVVTWDGINGGYFLKTSSSEFDALVGKRGGSWKNLSQYIYGATVTNAYVASHIEEYVYDIMPRGDQFIDEVVLTNMPSWKRVSFLVTHDVLVEPLTVYATNRTIDLKFYETQRWANYMAGIAVVVDAAGAVSLYPVRGYEVGWIGVTKSTSTCPEDDPTAAQ